MPRQYSISVTLEDASDIIDAFTAALEGLGGARDLLDDMEVDETIELDDQWSAQLNRHE